MPTKRKAIAVTFEDVQAVFPEARKVERRIGLRGKTVAHTFARVTVDPKRMVSDHDKFQPRQETADRTRAANDLIEAYTSLGSKRFADNVIGWLEPTNGALYVVSGFKRQIAAVKMGFDSFEVDVFLGTESEARQVAFLDNLGNMQEEPLKRGEIAKSVASLVMFEGMTEQEVFERTGIPVPEIRRILKTIGKKILHDEGPRSFFHNVGEAEQYFWTAVGDAMGKSSKAAQKELSEKYHFHKFLTEQSGNVAPLEDDFFEPLMSGPEGQTRPLTHVYVVYEGVKGKDNRALNRLARSRENLKTFLQLIKRAYGLDLKANLVIVRLNKRDKFDAKAFLTELRKEKMA